MGNEKWAWLFQIGVAVRSKYPRDFDDYGRAIRAGDLDSIKIHGERFSRPLLEAMAMFEKLVEDKTEVAFRAKLAGNVQ